jgi:trigger factor
MAYTLKTENNKATFTLTIDLETVERGMQHAAEHLSKDTKIPGFRPGKAPYDIVKQRFGEMALLEAAAEDLIRAEFMQAMMAENLEVVGQPYFDAEKLAPGNPIVVKAEVALAPKVKKLADWKKLSVKAESTEPKKETIERAKKDLTMMQTKEMRAKSDTKLKKGDKAVVDLTMKEGGVVLEGGEGQSHGIYTNEPHYIEGFVEKIIGAKEGEEKKFSLSFPEDHYQKHLAGKDIDFEVTVKEIFHLETPELDDDFAKKLGLKDAADLEEKLKANLVMEAETEERKRQEQEVIEAIIAKSTFEEVPDLLVNQEIERMIQELEQQVKQQGRELDEYLKSIGKSLAELKIDFTANALKRIQASMVLKAISEDEKVAVDEKEIDAELDRQAETYGEEAKKMIYSPEYRARIEAQMKQKAIIDLLLDTIVK